MVLTRNLWEIAKKTMKITIRIIFYRFFKNLFQLRRKIAEWVINFASRLGKTPRRIETELTHHPKKMFNY